MSDPIIIGNNGQIVITFPSTTTGSNYGYVTSQPDWLTYSITPANASKKNTGCHCKKCKDFNEFAEPNQSDGTFVCYSCRKGLK